MARLTSDQWIAARAAWESTPNMTATGLAEAIGVTRAAVLKRMKRDEAAGNAWFRQVSMAHVVGRAQALADKIEAGIGGERADRQAEVTPPRNQKTSDGARGSVPFAPDVAPAPTESETKPGIPGLVDPVAQRAEVIGRHRREWGVPRGLVSEAVKARDFDKAKLAKITSETLQIIQKGERTAWGLDILDPEDKPAVVVIERGNSESKK